MEKNKDLEEKARQSLLESKKALDDAMHQIDLLKELEAADIA